MFAGGSYGEFFTKVTMWRNLPETNRKFAPENEVYGVSLVIYGNLLGIYGMKLTANLPLKMDGWFRRFISGIAYFQHFPLAFGRFR